MSIRHAAHMTAVALGCNSMQTAGLWISKAHMLCSSGVSTHQTGSYSISPHICEYVQQQMCEQGQRNTANTNTHQGLHDYTPSPMQSQVVLQDQCVS